MCRSSSTQGMLGVHLYRGEGSHSSNRITATTSSSKVETCAQVYRIPAQESPVSNIASNYCFRYDDTEDRGAHLIFFNDLQTTCGSAVLALYFYSAQLIDCTGSSLPQNASLPTCSFFLNTCEADSLLKLMRLFMSTTVCSVQITKGHSIY